MTVVHPTRPRMVLGPLPAFAYQQCENLRRRGEILIIQNFNLIASLLCLTCRNSYESKREKKIVYAKFRIQVFVYQAPRT